MSTTDLPGSSLLAGRYRLVERLGAGGMSVVWRGFDEVLGRQVAVKVLPPSTSTDPAFRRRLRAEAQAAARLSHPNITNVYDYGEATTVDGEPVPYVVMELIDGESLAAVLARVRRLPWPHAVRLTAEVAAALAAAHSRGIVHRDVTPANVMLTQAGAKVVDFGISALIGENDIDPDGSLLGTPAYLAPERLEGGQVSPATDVYAVGLLIYRTLIGQLPWDVGTTTALLRAHQYTEPDPLPPVDGLPPAVTALVGRCLEKRPDDRPSSAELAHVLAGISAGAPAVGRGYVPDWADTGEDTTILPTPPRSYPDVIRRKPAAAQPLGSRSATVPPMAPPQRPAAGQYGSPADPHRSGHVPQRSAAAMSAAAMSAAPPSAEEPKRNSRFAALRSGPVRGAAAGSPALRPSGPPSRNGHGSAPASRRAAPGSNRRVVVLAGVVVALGLSLYGWSLASAAIRQPKAALGATVVPATGRCVVSYAVQSDDKQQFTARVTLANRDDAAIRDWSLWFVLPGDQQVTAKGAVDLVQNSNIVTVRSGSPIPGLNTIQMDIAGTYALNNQPPLAFQLNNRTCETFVSSKPGAPVHQVEQLADGTARLSASPTTSHPVPGVSIDPTGGVTITPTAKATTKSTTRTTEPTADPTTGSPTDTVAPEPQDTTIPPTATTAPPTADPTTTAPAQPTETAACELDLDPNCVITTP
jgi:serine/threonine protein kinase